MIEKVEVTLVLITLLAAIPGAAQDVPPRDFFVDLKTGDLHVFIIVGSRAAEEDIVSATMLAAKITTFAYGEPREVTFTKTYKTVHENVNPFLTNASISYKSRLTKLTRTGFPTVDVPDEEPYLQWEHNHTTPTNYTLVPLWYFDDYYNAVWGNADEHFQPWETHEEIQIRFDAFLTLKNTMFMTRPECYAYLRGGDMQVGAAKWYTVPGIIYRVDNIFTPPCVSIKQENVQSSFSANAQRYTHLFVPDPYFVWFELLPQFECFDTTYTVVDAGPILNIDLSSGKNGPLHGQPYLVTGEPHFEPRTRLYPGKPAKFSEFTVELLKVENNTAEIEISRDEKLIERISLVLDPENGFPVDLRESVPPFTTYEERKNLNCHKGVDVGEFSPITSYDYDSNGAPDYHKWVADTVKTVWAHYTWHYYEDTSEFSTSWLLYTTVDFIIDGVTTLDPVGGQGEEEEEGEGAVVNVYWLEDEKSWYNRLCCCPWVREPEPYQLFLDVYESGWDTIRRQTYVYQPPGTGLWPPAGLSRAFHSANSTFIGNGFLDVNDGHTGYEYNRLTSGLYFPEQNDLDRDGGTTNDCRYSDWSRERECTDTCDVEDPATYLGSGLILVEVNICSCNEMCAPDSGTGIEWVVPGPCSKDSPYFTVEVDDGEFTCRDTDGIEYSTLMGVLQTGRYSPSPAPEVDLTALIMLDTELNFAQWKSSCEFNLVLIGGPVVNAFVKQLVNEGISKVNWADSYGEWEWIKAPYKACDIIIIGGMDRRLTREAVISFIEELTYSF